jgi:hypothetical protein
VDSSVSQLQSQLHAADCAWDAGSNIDCPMLALVRVIVLGSDCALIEIIGDVLKICLDNDNDNRLIRDKFLNAFYDDYLHWLLLPLTHPAPLSRTSVGTGHSCRGGCALVKQERFQSLQDNASATASRRVIFEILSHCVQLHSYRIKYFIIRNSVLNSCNKVFLSPMRSVYLCAVKLLKDIICLKDDAYCKHIIKFDLLGPLVNLLRGTLRDNLITSSVLGLVEFIRRENIRSLVGYLVERFGDVLELIPSATVSGLRLRYEQNVNGSTMDSEGEGETEGCESKFSANDRAAQLKARFNRSFRESESEAAYFDDDAIPLSAQWALGATSAATSARFVMKSQTRSLRDPVRYLATYSSNESESSEDGVVDTTLLQHQQSYTDNSEAHPAEMQEIVNDSLDFPSLPPLKSKFEEDDSVPIFSAKARKSEVMTGIYSADDESSNPLVKRARATEEKGTPSGVDDNRPISFAMKKRSVSFLFRRWPFLSSCELMPNLYALEIRLRKDFRQ